MPFEDELQTLKTDLQAAGIPERDVLALSGIDRTSWSRWGPKRIPRADNWIRFKAAADRLIAERAQPQDAAA